VLQQAVKITFRVSALATLPGDDSNQDDAKDDCEYNGNNHCDHDDIPVP